MTVISTIRTTTYCASCACSFAVLIIAINAIVTTHGYVTITGVLGIAASAFTIGSFALNGAVGWNRPGMFLCIIAVEIGCIMTLGLLWIVVGAVATGLSKGGDFCRALAGRPTNGHRKPCTALPLIIFSWLASLILAFYLSTIILLSLIHMMRDGNRMVWQMSVFDLAIWGSAVKSIPNYGVSGEEQRETGGGLHSPMGVGVQSSGGKTGGWFGRKRTDTRTDTRVDLLAQPSYTPNYSPQQHQHQHLHLHHHSPQIQIQTGPRPIIPSAASPMSTPRPVGRPILPGSTPKQSQQPFYPPEQMSSYSGSGRGRGTGRGIGAGAGGPQRLPQQRMNSAPVVAAGRGRAGGGTRPPLQRPYPGTGVIGRR